MSTVESAKAQSTLGLYGFRWNVSGVLTGIFMSLGNECNDRGGAISGSHVCKD